MDKNVKKPLDRVLDEMRRLRLNNTQMADRLGITTSNWNNWKNRGIPESEYASVAARFNWSIDYLVHGKEAQVINAHMPLNVGVLREVIAFIEELLATYDRELEPEPKAEVIAAFYDDAMRRGNVDKATVKHMFGLMVKNL